MKIIIRPTCRKEIFLTTLFSALFISGYIYFDNIGMLNGIKNSSLLFLVFLGVYLLYQIIKCIIKKYWKYIIIEDNNKIIQKTFLLKNDIIIPISNQIIINTNQNFLQMLLKIIDIKVEADGDPTVPEIYIKDVSDKYYDIIKNLKFHN